MSTPNQKQRAEIEKRYGEYTEALSDTSSLEKSNLRCDCTSKAFYVVYIPIWGVGNGAFIKVTCVDCGKERVLYDDYS